MKNIKEDHNFIKDFTQGASPMPSKKAISHFNRAWSRRKFLAFISATGTLASCGHIPLSSHYKKIKKITPGLKKDDVTLVEGLNYEVLIKEGDKIGKNSFFGTNNDYINVYKFADGAMGLWVNHESLSPLLLHGRDHTKKPNKKQLQWERENVGGSFVEVKKDQNGKWKVVKNSDKNFKVSGNTKVKLSTPVLGSNEALGTLANCSGGYTSWGTVLTCEENYDHFYGERPSSSSNLERNKFDFKWVDVDPKPPEHYGWVVEVDPRTKKSEKLISLGRCAHECATVVEDNEGFPVVYTGDDHNDEHLYKFISSKKQSLKEGTLYVAHLEKNKWLPLDYKSSPILQKNFKDQTDVLIHARQASKLLGATPLDRPEDIEQDPISGDIFIALTNNKPKGNFHGSILKISEKNKSDLTFTHSVFRAGGTKEGFSCPDNMAFDKNGNLWITSDISGGSIGKGPYKPFGNNGLFVVPRSGKEAGQVIQVASAPNDAEFTGPFFSPDQKTLFLSVQHPGEKTKNLNAFTSHWPSGDKNKKPLSAVVAIGGELLESLTS